MLKTISVQQLKLGMYVYEIKGSWMDHPFWKKSFLLQTAVDLQTFKKSAVKQVVIDTAKGMDVEKVPVVAQPSAAEIEAQNALQNKNKKPPKTTFVEERENAKRVIESSKRAMSSMFYDVGMGKAINNEAAASLVDEISSSLAKNSSALVSLVRLKAQDDYTYMHSIAVCALMVALGKELELSDDEIKQAGLAGLMHDIGKATIPQEVLSKPYALTPQEFDLVKQHPQRGYDLLVEANVADSVILDVCLHHHEKMDGSGYPKKLKGDEISIFTKMAAICDVYDAITSNRPYKAGWEPGVSLQRMAHWADHFDQHVFKMFVKSVGIYPVGSMVILKSGRLAVVIDQTGKSLLKPVVKVFFSTKAQVRIPIEIIDLSRAGLNDEIVGHEDPMLWGISDINELWTEPSV